MPKRMLNEAWQKMKYLFYLFSFEICRFLWKLKVLCPVFRTCESRSYPVTPDALKIHFNIIFQFMRRSPKSCLSVFFANCNSVWVSHSPMHATSAALPVCECLFWVGSTAVLRSLAVSVACVCIWNRHFEQDDDDLLDVTSCTLV